jgi:hypothetical protein
MSEISEYIKEGRGERGKQVEYHGNGITIGERKSEEGYTIYKIVLSY